MGFIVIRMYKCIVNNIVIYYYRIVDFSIDVIEFYLEIVGKGF